MCEHCSQPFCSSWKAIDMKKNEVFNKSDFSRFINSPKGRLVRFANGLGFFAIGCTKRHSTAGRLSMIWGLIPLSAAILDVCYVSGLLGGPLSGKKIRSLQAGTEPDI
jgi:hypothetical protein